LSDTNDVLDKAALVKLIAFDVDGVLTDGRLQFTESGEHYKTFYVQDGLGLQLLQNSGCHIAIISARDSSIVTKRMQEIGITRIYQGVKDKRKILLDIMNDLGLKRSNIAYTGDDLVDIPALQAAGLAIAVANAHPMVKDFSHWTTENTGGAGAVREICEMILKAQGKLELSYKQYVEQ
jgi:3-deoxy-D-manno-octulosonate 8-phosphate phosphatase (KDO 8-P phosphatase)